MARPLQSLLTNPNPDVPRTKSLLARLTSPLTKRNNKSFELEIVLDQVYKTYGPSDTVKGHVLLHMYKGFDITHLTVSLHGTAVVFKHQCTPGEMQPVPELLLDRQGSHGFEYHGNGMASLFQDERVLAGSGFLKRGSYQFKFDLEFPSESLPTALEFERGAVSYMIRATVTRPTTMMPRTTKLCKINFQDRIDIESMYKPRSCYVTMEPVTKRGKVVKVKTAPVAEAPDQAPQTTSAERSPATRNSTPASVLPRPRSGGPQSPAPSEETAATAVTRSTRSLTTVEQEADPAASSPHPSEPRSSMTSNSNQTIQTTVELSRHGALPGDSIPLRVAVSHAKPARGIVIATLYRTGHVDMYPALPLAARGKKNKAEFEDVYPKSKTGLGGLYFSNSTPNMTFRKDLTQTSTMMIVDPETLTAEIRFSIRVPHDTFPSITNIPKQMIHFQYFVEIIVDVTGKMNETPLLPSLTTTGPAFTSAAQAGIQLTTDWANNILDTAPMRRTRAVAVFDLPLVVGTKDSRREWQRHSEKARADVVENEDAADGSAYYEHSQAEHWYPDMPGAHQGYHDGRFQAEPHFCYDEHGNPVYDRHDHYHSMDDQRVAPIPCYIPPPEIEEHPDDKSRLRREAELLLPSAPPGVESSAGIIQVSAPSAPTLDALSSLSPISASTGDSDCPPASIPITISRASARSADTIIPEPPFTPPPSLPDEMLHPSSTQHALTDDKQELESRRLMAQAGGPPDEDDDDEGGKSGLRQADSGTRLDGMRVAQAPSAPVIDEEEAGVAMGTSPASLDHLPQYER